LEHDEVGDVGSEVEGRSSGYDISLRVDAFGRGREMKAKASSAFDLENNGESRP
jgi:hypothetical protein